MEIATEKVNLLSISFSQLQSKALHLNLLTRANTFRSTDPLISSTHFYAQKKWCINIWPFPMWNPFEGGDTHGRSPLCCCCWGRVRDVDRWFQSSNQVILLPLGSLFRDPSLRILTSGPKSKNPGQGVLICDSFPLFQDRSVLPALCFLKLSSRFWLLYPPKRTWTWTLIFSLLFRVQDSLLWLEGKT